MELGLIKPVDIEDEMKGSYLDYAMSVIVSRALPDVRDGLKPVHRRILYAMEGLGLHHTSPYKKSARIVGEVLGKYHPHGDVSVYEAMVRMAQDFSMRYTLVDGQGNFGSVDNDPPAAMRYTEARMSKITEEMLVDIDKDTVAFTANFDGSLQEPSVLPSRLPNLLINGSSGIAVGMSTNIPPHNLGEVCDALAHLIDNPEAGVDDLIQFIPGPDFPTAGIILGQEGITNAYSTGHGKVVVRAKAVVGESPRDGRRQIVIAELPYQVNKAALVERIARLAREKKIEGISELRDESDRHGMCIVIELKREAQPQQVLNNLYKQTALQSAFFINLLALVDGQPRVINLKEALQYHIDFRQEIITRRSRFELKRAKEKAHILEGLKMALDHLDEVISIIRRSETTDKARDNLMQSLSLSRDQAQAILDLQLRRLAALERQKIDEEYTGTLKTIAYLEDLLANPRKILFLIKEEVDEVKAKYSDPRRTQLSEHEVGEFQMEDLVPHQEVAVTLSNRGYIKRLPSQAFKQQRRGGRGAKGMAMQETDGVCHLLRADTHDNLLFFTNRGKVFRLKCYDIPQDVSRTRKGMPLINLIPLDTKEMVTTVLAVADFTPALFMVLATCRGEIKKTSLIEFASVRSNGLIAMDLEKGDELVTARLSTAEGEVILISQLGKAIRFAVGGLRAASRSSGGVRSVRLTPGDQVVDMDVISSDARLLTISDNGFGKLTRLEEYPLHRRGGKGVQAHRITEKTGKVAGAKLVYPHQEVLLCSAEGIVIRTPVAGIPVHGRNTQGVSLMKPRQGDRLVCIAPLNKDT
jgi:DNA gyrase subunit A